ncbi:MAG: hypothetical protein CMH22_06135 [Methylophaga sp.]|nr:hypothetical protein [Methylophaga sp.]|tara:strand:+ start:48205 stop:48528 length:324 start_codon:yes stop_codon:yes gene_type:complete
MKSKFNSVDRIWVKPHKRKEKTDSGIYIPKDAKSENQVSTGNLVSGEVFIIGENIKEKVPNLEVGDILVYSVNGHAEEDLLGEDYHVIAQSHQIYAYFTPEQWSQVK